MHISNFCDSSGQIHAFIKSREDRAVFSTTPENIFLEKDLHTLYNRNGSRDTSLESNFADLEGKASPIIKKIISAARAGRLPSLTQDEKFIWATYFYYQWKRVPDVVRTGSSLDDFEETLRETVEQFEREVRPISFEEKRSLSDPAAVKRMKQNATATTIAAPSDTICNILMDRGLGIIRIKSSKKSFILGSRPVVKLTTNTHTHLSDDVVEAWLPISADIAISPISRLPREQLVAIEDAGHIRRLNLTIFRQSSIIAGPSASLIRSLIDAR